MDLMKYKQINNRKYYPGKDQNDTGLNFGTDQILQGLQFMGSLYNSFSGNKSVDDLYKESDINTNTINGVGYNTRSIDQKEQMQQLNRENTANTFKNIGSGATLGASIGGPIGAGVGAVTGLVGGLFGAHSRKNKLRNRLNELRQDLNYENNYNRASALDQSIKQNSNTVNSGMLYGANKGFDGNMNSYNKVWTPDGFIKGDTNSVVGKGESIIDFNSGKGSIVTKGKRGVDNQPSGVSPNDDTVILGNDINWATGHRFSDDAMPYTNRLSKLNKIEKQAGRFGNLSSLSKKTQQVQQKTINPYKQEMLKSLKVYADQQKTQHELENKYNEYPMYKDGYDGWIPSALNAISSIGNYIGIKNSYLRKPNSYQANVYENSALNTLRNLNINKYGYLRPMYDTVRQYNYAVNNSGGLTAGQKAAQRAAVALGTQKNIADVLNKIDEQNNRYKQSYAEALLNTGAANAQRRQQAYQYDDQAYSQAHGAKEQMLQTYRNDLYNAIWQGFANKNKYDMFKDTMNMYYQDKPYRERYDIPSVNYSMGDIKPKASANNIFNTTLKTPTSRTNTYATSSNFLPDWNSYLNEKFPFDFTTMTWGR